MKKYEFYINCYRGCDPESSEAARYMYIAGGLKNGETYINDEKV